MHSTTRRSAIRLQDAVASAPTLARLSQLAEESTAHLLAIRPLLPAPLRELVRAGAVDEAEWCLLVPHNAAAAKLRQLVPALLIHLQGKGHAVRSIRVKIARER